MQRVCVVGGVGVDVFEDVDADARVAGGVEINFLVVGDLADVAGRCKCGLALLVSTQVFDILSGGSFRS